MLQVSLNLVIFIIHNENNQNETVISSYNILPCKLFKTSDNLDNISCFYCFLYYILFFYSRMSTNFYFKGKCKNVFTESTENFKISKSFINTINKRRFCVFLWWWGQVCRNKNIQRIMHRMLLTSERAFHDRKYDSHINNSSAYSFHSFWYPKKLKLMGFTLLQSNNSMHLPLTCQSFTDFLLF